jgi:hypothetical protein
MPRWLRWAAAAGLGLALAACVPEFEKALTGGNPADPALIGSWSAKSSDDDNPMILDISAKDGGILVVMRDPKGSEEKLSLAGTSAEVAGVKYVSLKPIDADKLGAGGADVGYLVFRYAADGATFKVWALDAEKIGAAINAGKLKGTTSGTGGDANAKVSSDPAELAAFFATAEGQAAFQDKDPSDVLILTRNAP